MVDLHMHSRYSDDGESTPSELVEKSAKKEDCKNLCNYHLNQT